MVVPVYGNEATLPAVIERLAEVASRVDGKLEIVFVVDGSPDGSMPLLRRLLPHAAIASQVVAHSRNFGAFPAIRTGLGVARGQYIGVMAADLQEPPELMEAFFEEMITGEVDVAIGRREARHDPGASALMSRLFWAFYRRWIIKDIPAGGVDVFGCTRTVASQLIALNERHTSLVGQLFWLGFRRKEIPYTRVARESGKSAWTLSKRFRYLFDSVFSFTDLPIKLLTGIGVLGSVITVLVAIAVFSAWATGGIQEVGYTPIMLVVLFSTFSMLYGLGIVGSYVWRTYENSKERPVSIAMSHEIYGGRGE